MLILWLTLRLCKPRTIAHVSVVKGEKPKKSSGQEFKRWKHNMLFYLTTLNLARFLIEERPKLKEGEQDIQVVNDVDA